MIRYSLVIPVYKNEGSLPELLAAIEALSARLDRELEAVFVVDGSPDACASILQDRLPGAGFAAQLILHSRNFGSFPAISAGLAAGRGDYFAILAADLQEPISLAEDFFRALRADRCDVALGVRASRQDPWSSRVASAAFWAVYRALVRPDIPRGGVDVFGCNRDFRDHLVAFRESNSSLVALIFWLGFRRATFPYERAPRRHGKSAWTFRRKLRYVSDSIYSFSDLPIRALFTIGWIGVTLSIVLGAIVVVARTFGVISVPGYSATVITIMFFGALNLMGLGIVGGYAWRTFENGKARPNSVISRKLVFPRSG